MSNSVYPVLPGLRINVRRVVSMPPVLKRTTPSRREYRAVDSSLIKYRFVLSYEVLRAGAEAELQNIEAFFKVRRGSFDNFLFTVPDDAAVTNQLFGIGNGSTTSYQLTRSLGGYSELVYDLNGTPQIFRNGVLQATPANYSISATGLVTFTSAPASGHNLNWTGAYYWRCRFERDELEFERFLHQLYELRTVELITDPQ